jgi:hypothetical protein
VLSNDLKRGIFVRLNCGLDARIEDNKKGNIRMATVNGPYREIGSIYSMTSLGYGRTVPVKALRNYQAVLPLKLSILKPKRSYAKL